MVLKEIERMEFKYDVIVIGADMPAVKPLPLPQTWVQRPVLSQWT